MVHVPAALIEGDGAVVVDLGDIGEVAVERERRGGAQLFHTAPHLHHQRDDVVVAQLGRARLAALLAVTRIGHVRRLKHAPSGCAEVLVGEER
jgi:hypothetical protein